MQSDTHWQATKLILLRKHIREETREASGNVEFVIASRDFPMGNPMISYIQWSALPSNVHQKQPAANWASLKLLEIAPGEPERWLEPGLELNVIRPYSS